MTPSQNENHESLVLYFQLMVVGTFSLCLLLLTSCVAYAAASGTISVQALGSATSFAAGTGLVGFVMVLVRPLRDFLRVEQK
jgi:hypothetical protein